IRSPHSLYWPSIGSSSTSLNQSAQLKRKFDRKRRIQMNANLENDPTLTAATVSFHTDDENKDNDTHVTVTVRQREGYIAVRIDSDLRKFSDNSESGPFNLVVLNAARKSELRPGGNVTVRVDPKGNDVWQFNFFVDLIFSDESHLSCEAN